MRWILVLFAGVLLSVPAAARICMMGEPNIMVTHTQLTNQVAALRAELATKTDLANQINALRAELNSIDTRIDLIENPPAPPVDPLAWLLSWISASGTLSNSTTSNAAGQNGTWSVNANHAGTGAHTASGASMCSNSNGTFAVKGNPSTSNGQYCWCKMDNPRVGAWVFDTNFGEAANCATNCAYFCAGGVQGNVVLRAVVLAPL